MGSHLGHMFRDSEKSLSVSIDTEGLGKGSVRSGHEEWSCLGLTAKN